MNLQKSFSLNFRLFSFRFLLKRDFTEEIEDKKLYIEGEKLGQETILLYLHNKIQKFRRKHSDRIKG